MIMPVTNNTKKKIAPISSYLPRKCAIAAFAFDLIANIRRAAGQDFEPLVVVMDSDMNLEYQSPVKIRVRKDVRHDYLAAISDNICRPKTSFAPAWSRGL